MTGSQLALDLKQRPAMGRAAFLVAPSNAQAVRMIDTWPDWPEGKLALTGPEGSGKTHLAHVWAETAGARVLGLKDLDPSLPGAPMVIEDVDRIADLPEGERKRAEETVFHLHNATLSAGGGFLVTGRGAPAHWNIGLPDLASRLRAAPVAGLDTPDDILLGGVLVKLFADRQIKVGAPVVAYLLRRIERSIPAAARAVAAIDAASLARKKPVTRPFAAEVMDGMLG